VKGSFDENASPRQRRISSALRIYWPGGTELRIESLKKNAVTIRNALIGASPFNNMHAP